MNSYVRINVCLCVLPKVCCVRPLKFFVYLRPRQFASVCLASLLFVFASGLVFVCVFYHWFYCNHVRMFFCVLYPGAMCMHARAKTCLCALVSLSLCVFTSA